METSWNLGTALAFPSTISSKQPQVLRWDCLTLATSEVPCSSRLGTPNQTLP